MAHAGVVGRRESAGKFRAAAASLGIDLIVYSPNGSAQCGSSDSGELLDHFIARSTIITVDLGCEHDTLRTFIDVADRKLRPNSSTIHLAHDPLAARYVFRDCGFDVAEFEEVDTGDDVRVQQFGRQHGWPVRLRQPCWGLDGPAVHVVRPYSVLDRVWAGSSAGRWLLETWAPLAPQLAVVVARRPSGDQVVLGVTATPAHHCRSRGETPVSACIRERAISTTRSIVDGLDATGVVIVRFICSADGQLLVDDITYGPAADTAASWVTSDTLVAAHLRAILDLDPDRASPSPSGRCHAGNVAG